MASAFCSYLFGCFFGDDASGSRTKDGHGVEMDRGGGRKGGAAPRIQYQLQPRGPDVKVIHPSTTNEPLIKGQGVALLSIPLEQDSAYLELHVRKSGAFTVGVSRAVSDAQVLAEGPVAWGLEVEPAQLCPPSESESDAEAAGPAPVEVPDSEGRSIPVQAKAGDVIALLFSQSSFPMLSFRINDRALEGKSVERVRGLVYPAIHLKAAQGQQENGPCVSFALHEDDWAFKPPSSRYLPVMESRDMI